MATRMNDHCSSFSSGSKFFHHQNIKPVFIALPQKISSLVKYTSLVKLSSLLNAKEFGRQQNLEKRFPSVSHQQQHGSSEVRSWDTMHANNAPTIDDLYQVVKILRADRLNVLQRLIIAYEAGRKVDLHNELKFIPVVLAEINGSLRIGKKSVLADLITSGINCPSEIELQGSSCLLIDGLALASAIGRPSVTQTFRDFADSFQTAVLEAGSRYQHIHVIFGIAAPDKVVVVAVGFVDKRELQSSERAIDLSL